MAANDIDTLFNVRGMVAVITGGGSGLGLYAARALDANGAKKVYIVGRREQTLKDAAATAKNGTIVPIVGDVSSKDSLKKVTDQIEQDEGYVNFLFANAGVSGPKTVGDIPSLGKGERPSIEEYQAGLLKPKEDDFTATAHVNVTGVYYTVAAFLHLLDAGNKKQNLPQDSQVVVTSSVAGFSRHLASSYAYSTSKAAVNHLVKMLSTSFAQNHFCIRVNLIAPGLYPSEMTTASTSKLDAVSAFEGAGKLGHDFTPAERTGSEADFAGTVLFLASKAGAYLNGETLLTDGGRVAQLPGVY